MAIDHYNATLNKVSDMPAGLLYRLMHFMDFELQLKLSTGSHVVEGFRYMFG